MLGSAHAGHPIGECMSSEIHVLRAALGEGRTVLSEHESKQVLKAYGIPVTNEKEVHNDPELREALAEIGFPLVMKASAPNLTHKTERGLVHVDIRNEQEAAAAFSKIMDEIEGEKARVLIQEMIKGSRELVAGLTRDPQFGPCVMFGLGGLFAEILQDISFRVAPVEKSEALDMIHEIKGRKILESVRGMPAADLDRLADILIRLGDIGIEQQQIKDIDINPIILSKENGPVAVDALIVLNP